MILAILVAWLVQNYRKRSVRFKKTALDVPLLLFFGVSVLSVIKSLLLLQLPLPEIDTSLSPIYPFKALLNLFEFTLLYFLAVNTIKKKHIRKFTYALLIPLPIVSIIGIIQYFFSPTLYFSVNSTLNVSNFLGLYLILLIPLCLTLKLKGWKKRLLPVTFALSLICLWFSYARGAWLGLAVALIGFFFYKRGASLKKIIWYFGLLGAATLFVFLLIIPLFSNQWATLRSGDWNWADRNSCEQDVNASCFFNMTKQGISMILHPAGDALPEKWLSQILIEKPLYIIPTNQTMLEWSQEDSRSTGFIILDIVTLWRNYKLTYARCAPNHWHRFGWVNLSDDKPDWSCGSSKHERNVIHDFVQEYPGIQPLYIERIQIGHFYLEDAEDISFNVTHLKLRNGRTHPTTHEWLQFDLLKKRKKYPLFRRLVSGRLEQGRIDTWKLSLQTFMKHPWLGIGLGTFRHLDVPEEIHHAHNIFLHVLVERGIFALLALCLIVALIWIASGHKPSNAYKNIHQGFVIGLAAFLLYNLVEYSFYSERVTLISAIVLAIFMQLSSRARD